MPDIGEVLRGIADQEETFKQGWRMKLALLGWSEEAIEAQLAKATTTARVGTNGHLTFDFKINLPEEERNNGAESS